MPTITRTPAYFREIAKAMRAQGWEEGLPPNRHPGGMTLSKQGITAFYYRTPDEPDRGVLRIYGECGNMTDHQADTGSFIDITDRLSG